MHPTANLCYIENGLHLFSAFLIFFLTQVSTHASTHTNSNVASLQTATLLIRNLYTHICTQEEQPSGAILGSVFGPRTPQHANWRSQWKNHWPSNKWMTRFISWATAALRWHSRKLLSILKVSRMGTRNVCTKFHRDCHAQSHDASMTWNYVIKCYHRGKIHIFYGKTQFFKQLSCMWMCVL